jgi:hypothetical protein
MGMYPFMAKHLSLELSNVLDADGDIDEEPSKVLSHEKLAVFNSAFPIPKNAVKGNEAVMKLLK